MAQKSLLTIETEGGTETVVIDGLQYALTDFDSFSVVEQHKISRLGKSIEAFMAADELDEEKAEQVATFTDELFEKISGNIPDDVKKKLKPGARQRITSAYFLAFVGAGRTPEATPSEAGLATQSPDSKDSTEGKSTPGCPCRIGSLSPIWKTCRKLKLGNRCQWQRPSPWARAP